MEKKHRDKLRDKYHFAVDTKEIVVLDIPDEYSYMDTELIMTLQAAVSPYLA